MCSHSTKVTTTPTAMTAKGGPQVDLPHSHPLVATVTILERTPVTTKAIQDPPVTLDTSTRVTLEPSLPRMVSRIRRGATGETYQQGLLLLVTQTTWALDMVTTRILKAGIQEVPSLLGPRGTPSKDRPPSVTYNLWTPISSYVCHV